MAEFGELLAELRRDKNMTQRDLADVLHVSTGTISNYEKGVHFPDVEKVIDLANFFDVSIDYLLGRCHSNLTPDIFNEQFIGNKTIGSFLTDIQNISPERKRALAIMVADMKLGTMVGGLNSKEETQQL